MDAQTVIAICEFLQVLILSASLMLEMRRK